MVRCLARYVEILTVYRCTTLHNTEPGLAAAATANICFFSANLISSQDGWNVSHFYLYHGGGWSQPASH